MLNNEEYNEESEAWLEATQECGQLDFDGLLIGEDMDEQPAPGLVHIATKEKVLVSGSPFLLGRDKDSDLPLIDKERDRQRQQQYSSKQHAVITKNGDEWCLSSTGTNGTAILRWPKGRPFATKINVTNKPCTLLDGDVIVIGSAVVPSYRGLIYKWTLPTDNTDKELRCGEHNCGKIFTFTVGEQSFYDIRGWECPKRCAECRKANKNRRESRDVENFRQGLQAAKSNKYGPKFQSTGGKHTGSSKKTRGGYRKR